MPIKDRYHIFIFNYFKLKKIECQIYTIGTKFNSFCIRKFINLYISMEGKSYEVSFWHYMMPEKQNAHVRDLSIWFPGSIFNYFLYSNFHIEHIWNVLNVKLKFFSDHLILPIWCLGPCEQNWGSFFFLLLNF